MEWCALLAVDFLDGEGLRKRSGRIAIAQFNCASPSSHRQPQPASFAMCSVTTDKHLSRDVTPPPVLK